MCAESERATFVWFGLSLQANITCAIEDRKTSITSHNLATFWQYSELLEIRNWGFWPIKHRIETHGISEIFGFDVDSD